MKKLFGVFLALCSALAFGATTLPVQLLNPIGSTSGQTVISTGPSSAPGWSTMVVANVAGAAALTGATFTGPIVVTDNAAIVTLTLSNTSSGNGAQISMLGDGATTPQKTLRVTAGQFGIVNNAFSSQILTLTDAGVLSTTGGITGTPVSGSTGSFTTLSASSTVTVPAGTTLNQPNLVGVTNGASASAGSVGQIISASVPVGSAIALTSGTAANVTSIPVTAGDWDVWGQLCTNPNGATIQSNTGFAINTTSAALNPAQEALLPFTAATGASVCAPIPVAPLSVTTGTTVFLVGFSSFSGSTNSVYGSITARRRR